MPAYALNFGSRLLKWLKLALLLTCLASFSGFWHGSAALTPGAITCVFTTGACTGIGGGSGLFTAATCNGVADDAAANTSFNSFARTWQGSHAGLIELDIPHGATCMFVGIGNCSNGSNCPGDGIKQFRIVGLGYSGQGDGATFSDGGTGRGFFLGAFKGVVQDNTHSARLQSSNVGDSCVTLVTAGQTSLFTVGNIALISGIDMQGGGFPPNPYFYEWPKIASIDASHKCDGSAGGSITFTAPLANKYLSTWPVYSIGNGSEVDQGGPATLYAMDSAWDTEQTYIGVTFTQNSSNTYSIGRNITYQNVKFTGGNCAIPTQNQSYVVKNSDFTTCDMEVDKIIGTLTLNGVTINQVNFQSSSVNQYSMVNSTVLSSHQGTPKKMTCAGSTIAGFLIGAHALGRTSEVDVGNCNVSGMAIVSVTDKGGGEQLGGTSNPGFNFAREMSSGTIKTANTVLITNAVDQGGGVLRLTVACQTSIYPTCSDATAAFTVGKYYELSNLNMSSGLKQGNYSVAAKNSGAGTVDINLAVSGATYVSSGQIGGAVMNWLVPGTNIIWAGQLTEESLAWQVTAARQDGNWTYADTSLAGGFPTIPTFVTPAGNAIGISVHPAPKFTCSGCSGDVNAVAFGLDPSHGPYGSYWQRAFVDGTSTPVVPVFGNVSSVTFAVNTPYAGGGTPNFNLDGPNTVNSAGATAPWTPQINVKNSGSRVVTLSGVTGTQAGDTGLTVPDSTFTFLADNQITAKYSASVAGDPVSTVLTIQTNQGVVYPPAFPFLLKRDLDPASNDNSPMWLDKAA